MLNTTISMWLGILFLVLAIAAVLLQAWLWGPKFWDEDAKKTKAPRAWLRIHAGVGYTYGLIYLVMMWNMVPRMWLYQYELPARTVIHAVVAMILGVVLISKIVILKFFRHFEEAMPKFGFAIMTCTVVLIGLSVPYALKAHDVSGRLTDADNVARVDRLLADIEFEVDFERAALTTESGFQRGQQILVSKCTTCHDMRTILIKPRTATGWHSVSRRMLDKPAVYGDQLKPEDIPWVTAYLVAITPDIQESLKKRRETQAEARQRADAVGEAVHQADDFDAAPLDDAASEALYQAKCTECHENDEVDAHGGDDSSGWRSVVAAMVEEGAEISDEEAVQLAAYLAKKHPSSEPAPALEPEPKPKPEPEPEPEADTGGEPEAGTGGEQEPDEPEPKEPTKKKKPKPKGEPKEPAKPKEPKKPKADKAAGKSVFLKKCKSCHGNDGKGDTPYGQKISVPNLATSSLSKGKMEAVIRNGVSGTKMKAYGTRLSDEEITNILAWIRGL